MTGTRGYAAGIAGLAGYLGKSPKSTRALLLRVKIPSIRLPGVTRETILFKLSDVDEALARYRVDVPVQSDVDVESIVASVLGPRRAAR